MIGDHEERALENAEVQISHQTFDSCFFYPLPSRHAQDTDLRGPELMNNPGLNGHLRVVGGKRSNWKSAG